MKEMLQIRKVNVNDYIYVKKTDAKDGKNSQRK